MRKKLKLTTIVLIFLVLVIIVILTLNKPHIQTFSINMYQEYIDTSLFDKKYGYVKSSKDAIAIAETVLIEKYGSEIYDSKPYKVSFDAQNNIFLVEGQLKKGSFGGVPHILISQLDGSILGIWHDQ